MDEEFLKEIERWAHSYEFNLSVSWSTGFNAGVEEAALVADKAAEWGETHYIRTDAFCIAKDIRALKK